VIEIHWNALPHQQQSPNQSARQTAPTTARELGQPEITKGIGQLPGKARMKAMPIAKLAAPAKKF